MRVFTCTPVRFTGDAGHFARESGLFSVGLNLIGVESRPIMPGPPMEGDDPRLMRTEYGNLESDEWWRSLKLDGLILYSWAAPRYNRIAEAVRKANIPVMVNMDMNGLISPLANRVDWFREIHVPIFAEGTGLRECLKGLIRALIEVTTHSVPRRRLKHYESATVISACTPHAARWIPNEAIRLGRPDLASKFLYLPHPQLPAFHYDGTQKERLIITVGRWHRADWGQKNPRLLLETYRHFLSERPDWSGMIIGAGAPELCCLLGFQTSDFGGRLAFLDQIAPESLPMLYRRARIGLWTSRWEGQQGAAAQALCCGCSVVAPSAALNSCFRHYITRESGRLASRHDAEAMNDELMLEAAAWESGQRDPARIGTIWSGEFHADQVASRALHSLGLVAGS